MLEKPRIDKNTMRSFPQTKHYHGFDYRLAKAGERAVIYAQYDCGRNTKDESWKCDTEIGKAEQKVATAKEKLADLRKELEDEVDIDKKEILKLKIEVSHNPRIAGRSKYGISRVFKVLADLFSLQMLTRFRESPIRLFGVLGLPFLAAALVAGLAAIVSWPSPIVMPAITILCSLSFLSCVFYGLLGEAIVESAGRDRARRMLYARMGPGH